MESMINLGIDLGTTNSAIAKFIKGDVTVYSNPTDTGRNTLPSVVGFKKDKIFVGSKAKELITKDPKSVVGSFKRKMGTTESFMIKNTNESKKPIELSSLVLKELKTFLPPSENTDAVVITIPASFDMIQSNATKEAGKQAGFKQVVLLQEPIAASLAYSNIKKQRDLKDGQWLVYDLGGGTFDAALIRIKNGEMKVLDHEGDNFLGGTDFDTLIVDKIIIPILNEKYVFNNIEEDLKSATGRLNAKYYNLLYNSEQAKILLSSKTSADILIDGIIDDEGNEIDEEIVITRSDFNELIKESIDNTINMIKRIITRNTLKSNDLQFVLMIGGSTYIPFVRQRVEEVLQIPINCEIDPTTAVAVGAAFYAATKKRELDDTKLIKRDLRITIKASYEKTSKEREELFSAKISGVIDNLFYRITREDGGFDSGLKKLTERISEDLPIVENTFNFFKLTIYDDANNVIDTDFDMIGINSGFGISGQPLPEDICIQVDDEEHPGETKLLLVFPKNTILPISRDIRRVLNKGLLKGDSNESILIKIFEGPEYALPEANKLVGFIKISGMDINRSISKGSDIELTFSISESRDLTVSAYLNMANQEFTETFNPNLRHTPTNELKEEMVDLSEKLDLEIEQATELEKYETANELNKLKREMNSLLNSVDALTDDDVTDSRYKLEDKKRKIAQAIDDATRNKRIDSAKSEYFEQKERCLILINENGNDYERKHYNDIVSLENSFLNSTSPMIINAKRSELRQISAAILWRTPGFLISLFRDLVQSAPKMNDQTQVTSLIDAGKFAIESENWSRLSEINNALLNQLPKSVQQVITTKIGF